LLKLQSRSRSTPHRDRDCHPSVDKIKEGCASHRLHISIAITDVRKSRRLHLTKCNTKYKQSDIKNNSRTSMDTCTYRHTWKRSGPSAGKKRKQEQRPNYKLSYQEAKTFIRNKRLADFKHRNGGYYSQQDTLRLLSRHETDHDVPAKNRPLQTS